MMIVYLMLSLHCSEKIVKEKPPPGAVKFGTSDGIRTHLARFRDGSIYHSATEV